MQRKSTLGIPFGVLAAAMYILCLYSGALATLLVAGYVLLKEKDEWMKTQAVKVVLLMLVFAVVAFVIDLIPDAIGVVSSFLGIFGGSLSIPVISSVTRFLSVALSFLKTLIFLGLAYKSLSEKTIKVPFVDSIVSKVASGEATELKDLSDDFKEDLGAVKESLGKAKDDIVNAVDKTKDKTDETTNN